MENRPGLPNPHEIPGPTLFEQAHSAAVEIRRGHQLQTNILRVGEHTFRISGAPDKVVYARKMQPFPESPPEFPLISFFEESEEGVSTKQERTLFLDADNSVKVYTSTRPFHEFFNYFMVSRKPSSVEPPTMESATRGFNEYTRSADSSITTLSEWEVGVELNTLYSGINMLRGGGFTRREARDADIFAKQTNASKEAFNQVIDLLTAQQTTYTTTILDGETEYSVGATSYNTVPTYVTLSKSATTETVDGLVTSDHEDWHYYPNPEKNDYQHNTSSFTSPELHDEVQSTVDQNSPASDEEKTRTMERGLIIMRNLALAA